MASVFVRETAATGDMFASGRGRPPHRGRRGHGGGRRAAGGRGAGSARRGRRAGQQRRRRHAGPADRRDRRRGVAGGDRPDGRDPAPGRPGGPRPRSPSVSGVPGIRTAPRWITRSDFAIDGGMRKEIWSRWPPCPRPADGSARSCIFPGIMHYVARSVPVLTPRYWAAKRCVMSARGDYPRAGQQLDRLQPRGRHGPAAQAGSHPRETRPGRSGIELPQNIRVADIQAVYKLWSGRGAQFLTPPTDRGPEIRCYLRDPDGHLIEVGQLTAAGA